MTRGGAGKSNRENNNNKRPGKIEDGLPQDDLGGKEEEFFRFFVNFDLDLDIFLFTVYDLFDRTLFLLWRELHDGIGWDAIV